MSKQETYFPSRMLATPQELARTYAPPNYTDPWDLIQDYQRVLKYTSTHPNKGSTAIANALHLPRSRIRPWMDGSIPDAVRGIRLAERKNWLNLSFDDALFYSFNALVAWIFAGGSIDESRHVPLFTIPSPEAKIRLKTYLAQINCEYELVREADPERATEARPKTGGAVLGRLLIVLGAPVGTKNESAQISLPAYLQDAPPQIRSEFIDVYLMHRGQESPEKDTITFKEVRSDAYLQDLAALIESVAGASVKANHHSIVVSAEAARQLKKVISASP